MSWKNFTRTTGIYSITNKTNNRKYIGQSKDIGSRWKQHLYQLRRNSHHCQALQEDWNKYSYEDFTFQVELICTKKYLSEKEIEIWDKYEDNYNGRPTGQTYPEHTEQTKNKISDSMKGNTHSEKTKSRISDSMKGNKHSEETKRKMSEARKEYWKKRKENT